MGEKPKTFSRMFQDKYVLKSNGCEEIYIILDSKEDIQNAVLKKKPNNHLRRELFKNKKPIADVNVKEEAISKIDN